MSKSNINNSATPERWVDMIEAAAFLGVKESYIKNKIKEIPHIKIGRLNRFRLSDLNEYALNNGRY